MVNQFTREKVYMYASGYGLYFIREEKAPLVDYNENNERRWSSR
jgi:hypothetical protein